MAGAAGPTVEAWATGGVAAWRRVRRRLRTGPLARWRLAGRAPTHLAVAPPDLRPANPQVAVDIYHGRFPLDGHAFEPGGISPFGVTDASPAWRAALHGFRWLRHMRAAGSGLAAVNARALVSDWIESHGRRVGGIAWAPDVVAQRIVAWLAHAPTVLASTVNGAADQDFERAFLRSLGLQVRFLRIAAPEMPVAAQRLQARAALAFAALCLPASEAALRRAGAGLAHELDRQVLPDGGHVSRNPEVLADLLLDLLPLRRTYASRGVAPPAALAAAIERMLPMLRFFRHGDGTLARFNGVGATAHDRVDAVLRHDEAQEPPPRAAPFSGYQRLEMGGTLVIADTGPVPPPGASEEAHAGCLSFELSSGAAPARPRHFIVNAGTDRFGAPDFRPLGRATAAHSTAVLEDTSSARFRPVPAAGGGHGAPLAGGPRHVPSERLDTADTQAVTASHDGYLQRFGLIHHREIRLSEDGNLLGGVDRFLRPGKGPPRPGRDRVALRFHLHPEVELLRDKQGATVIHVPGGDYWTLHSPDLAPGVEESIFFAGPRGPRRSRQIVLAFHASALPAVRWWWMRGTG